MNLILTLTNIQIVRNSLFDPNIDLLKNIKYSKIVLVCNQSTFEIVEKHVSKYPDILKDKIEILLMNTGGRSSLSKRFLDLVFKCSVSSKFAVNKFFRLKSKKEISLINLLIKLILFLMTYKNKFFATLIRTYYFRMLASSHRLSQLSSYRNYNLAVTLSMTDEVDCLVAIFARYNNIFTIGTVRSWDNLTSHGLLKIKPNIFYCHSQSMYRDLICYQYFDRRIDEIVIGHSYWINFQFVDYLRSKPKSNEVKILFGSMGLYFNPSEIELLDEIYVCISNGEIAKVSFTILMHPKFSLPSYVQDKYSSLFSFHTFKFDNFDNSHSYSDYLEYLDGFSLILSSGSTLLLDSYLINKKVAHISFELNSVPYWESIKRYMDFREYYKNFIKLSNTPVLTNFSELQDLFRQVIIKGDRPLSFNECIKKIDTAKLILGDPNSVSLVNLINQQVC
jgi:hypothetical protein